MHSPCFIDHVVVRFVTNALWEFSGYRKTSVLSWLFNIALWSTVFQPPWFKGPATIVVKLWINLFCCPQTWMQNPSSMWSQLCIHFPIVVVRGPYVRTRLLSEIGNTLQFSSLINCQLNSALADNYITVRKQWNDNVIYQCLVI